MIDGVHVKPLTTYADERGFFRELMRSTDPVCAAGFGQLSHSLVHAGVVKAWHGHVRQHQWNHVVNGLIKVALHDARHDSPTKGQTMEFLVGDHQPCQLYAFPPGVLHGYRCIAGPMNIIYVTSGTYEPEEEVRIPHDDPGIGYDWLKQVIR